MGEQWRMAPRPSLAPEANLEVRVAERPRKRVRVDAMVPARHVGASSSSWEPAPHLQPRGACQFTGALLTYDAFDNTDSPYQTLWPHDTTGRARTPDNARHPNCPGGHLPTNTRMGSSRLRRPWKTSCG